MLRCIYTRHLAQGQKTKQILLTRRPRHEGTARMKVLFSETDTSNPERHDDRVSPISLLLLLPILIVILVIQIFSHNRTPECCLLSLVAREKESASTSILQQLANKNNRPCCPRIRLLQHSSAFPTESLPLLSDLPQEVSLLANLELSPILVRLLLLLLSLLIITPSQLGQLRHSLPILKNETASLQRTSTMELRWILHCKQSPQEVPSRVLL